MRVLYIHQYFTTAQGAGGTRSYEFAKALIARGHSVTMLCGSAQRGVTGLTQPFSKDKRQGLVEGIEVIEIDLAYSNYDGFFKRALKFMKFIYKTLQIVLTGKYDLLYATSTPLTVAIPGIFAKIFRRKPFVLEIRDLWPELPKAMGVVKNPLVLSGLGLLERMAYRFADVGVGLSPGICEGMARFGTLPKDKITLIPNGCDIEILQKNEPMDEGNIPLLLRELLATKFTVVFCGAHGLANGLDAALDAAARLQKQGLHHIALIFIGDGKSKPQLMERVKKEALTNSYFFDPIAKTALSWVLQRAGIGMMLLKNIPAFYYGTSPNKFFDYIASGLPVLNNYPGWVAELIAETQCGIVVPPDASEAFANALIDFSKLSKTQWQVFSHRALQLAKERFNREALSAKFVMVCEQVYDQKNR